MSTGITVLNTKQVSLFLNAKKKLLQGNVKKGLSKAAIYVHGEVKESIAGKRAEPTSVDTGQLLNSVGFEAKDETAMVFSNIEHAGFIENGTSRIPARHHFRNSKDRSKKKISELIGASIKL